MPSPLRRPEKANNCLKVASSGSVDSIGSLVAKQKVQKEKSVTQLTYEAKKIDETEKLNFDAAPASRNLRDARVFRAMFQKKKANTNVADRPEERDRRDNFSLKAQPNPGCPGDMVDNCSAINREALKENHTDKAHGRVLFGESSGCSGLLYGHLENDCGVEHTSQLDNTGTNVKEASSSEGPNCSVLVSDKTTVEVIRNDIHLSESPKELFISNDVGKVYQPRHIYDCHHQRGESKDGDGMEVTHSVKCPSGLPNGILEKEGGVVIRREQLSCHIDENLQTSVVRNSISNEESVIDCDVHESCESSPSSKRKRSLVDMDADMSTRNSNEDMPDMLASGTSSLDNCYKPVRESETCLKRKREDNNPTKQGVHSCDAEVAQESFEWTNTKVRDETQDTANNGQPGKTNNVQQMTPSMHLEANDHKNMCLTCGLGGKLLSQDKAGVRVSMSDKEVVPLDAVENFDSNGVFSSKEQICTQNRDDTFQASESSSRHITHIHPHSTPPCAEGILYETKSTVIHEDLSPGAPKNPHLGTSAERMSSVNVQPNEEIISCAVSRTTKADALPVPFTVSSDDGSFNVAKCAPLSEEQNPDEIGLSLPNAELDRVGYVSSSGSCMNNIIAVDQISSEERITNRASVSVPDKNEPIIRNAMVGSGDDPETAVPVDLPLLEQASEGATINLSEVQVLARTAETVSNELVRCANRKENGDMIVTSLNNASLADQHGDICRTICENAYSLELPLHGSLSRKPLETLSGNTVVYLNETLQGEGSSSTFNGMRCVDATVGKKKSQLVEQPYPASDNALSERMNCQELAKKNQFSLEKSLSSRLEPFHLLAASSSQHYPCSTEIVSHNLMQPMVPTIVNAAERSNLVSAEPASNPEPYPLGDPTVTGLPNVLSEARSTLSTSDNNRPLQSALQMVSRIPPPSHMDPLQNEIERIKKEMEQEKKNHEDMKLCLKSDCEKEIEEVITQIRRKYDVKFQEIEVDYLNKKTAFDTSQNAVLMHKILAEAFRSKCMDLKLPRAPGIQQDASRTQQQLVQLSRLQIAHRPPMVVATPSSSVLPAPCPQNMLNTINLQRVVPAVQAAHNQSTAFSSISTRPQVSSIPLPPTVNIQSIYEIRAPAPHLQPYRPSSSLVTTNLSILTHAISNQQVPSNNVVAAASIPQLPTFTPASNYQSGPQNRPPWAEIAGGISCPNSSLSALELLMDVDNGSVTVMPENLSPNSAPTAGTSEIVYLSDDD